MTILQQKDTTFTKIFVGGLPYHTTDKTLREFFQQFGEIEEAVVITDRQSGKSRGYGFVTMSDRISTEMACQDPNPIIDGRKANVNLAYIGAKPRIPATEILGLPFGLKSSAFSLPGYIAGQIPVATASYPNQYICCNSPSYNPSPHTIPASLVSAAPFLDFSMGTGIHVHQPMTSSHIQVPNAITGNSTTYEMFTQNGTFLPQMTFGPTSVPFVALPHQGDLIGHYTSHFQPAHIQ